MVILPPFPVELSKPLRPSEPLLPLDPLGVPIPPEPPWPPRPPLPPEPPAPPSALTVSEPPRGSTKYSFCLPAAETLTWRRGLLPDRNATRTCTGGASPPFPPSPPLEPSVPFPPFPPAEGLFGSLETMLPLKPAIPSLPLMPLEPLLTAKFEVTASWYRTVMSSSARRSGWLGTVMVTCPNFPSLFLGSWGS